MKRMRKFFNVCVAVIVEMVILGAGPSRPTGTIQGVVTGCGRRPEAGVSIFVLGTDPTVGAMSQSDGSFVIKGVPTGTFTLKALKMGFKSLEQPGVIVRDGVPAKVRLALTSKTPRPPEAPVVVSGVIRSASDDRPIKGVAVTIPEAQAEYDSVVAEVRRRTVDWEDKRLHRSMRQPRFVGIALTDSSGRYTLLVDSLTSLVACKTGWKTAVMHFPDEPADSCDAIVRYSMKDLKLVPISK